MTYYLKIEIKSSFVCMVASAFEATTAKHLFGKHKNAIYF